jgi:hypothetical protein
MLVLHRYISAFPTWIGTHLQSINGVTDISLLKDAERVVSAQE